MKKLRESLLSSAHRVLLSGLFVLAPATFGVVGMGYAQDMSALTGQKAQSPDAPMILAADQLVYDRDLLTVTAQGNVRIEYDGNRVVAETVSYNQNTRRVIAQGNVEIVESDGNRIYTDYIDMTDDLGEGFVNALRVESADNTRFAAESAERSDGQLTVFNNGVYTACEACQANPEKDVLWQVKARRIIWNGASKTMRFEDSQLEMFGVPIAYFPAFEMADPTVKRKSGFLFPSFAFKTDLGFGVKNAYFWNLAPNYDFTLGVTGYTKQGILTEGEWRHRLENGRYNIRFAHIYQLNPDDFDNYTINREQDNRYMVATKGDFSINPRWRYGWDIMAQSDHNFSYTYDIEGYANEVHRSQIYLVGLSGRNYFDARLYRFTLQENLLESNPNERYTKQPWVLPRIDYSFIPDESIWGGELNIRSNIQGIYRDESDVGAFSTENTTNRTRIPGVNGTSFRWSSEVEWKRSFVTNHGLVVTPIMALRGDAMSLNANDQYGATDLRNETWRGMATAGIELRYPFLFSSANSSHIIEPIAQVFIRNDEDYIGRLVNEDAQSFVFDATTLFQRDKFSGYDRVEGGTRANVGLRYSGSFNNGWSLYALGGQSYHLGGRNSFAYYDLVNVGSDSGLQKSRSDYVAMLGLDINNGFALAARGRFDESSLRMRRGEIEARKSWQRFSLSTQYAFIEKQPDYGYSYDRQEVTLSANTAVAQNWTISGSVSYDIESDTFVRSSTGLSYADECFALMLNYLQTRRPGDNKPSHGIGFLLSFRTLADIGSGL